MIPSRARSHPEPEARDLEPRMAEIPRFARNDTAPYDTVPDMTPRRALLGRVPHRAANRGLVMNHRLALEDALAGIHAAFHSVNRREGPLAER